MAKKSSASRSASSDKPAKKAPAKAQAKGAAAARPKKAASKPAKAPKAAKAKAEKPAKEPRAAAAPQPTVITNYATALRWLGEQTDLERMRMIRYTPSTFNLDRMRNLLNLLGDPQDQVRFVQIAGTKGKGSTVAMLAGMLGGCGYTVGIYTSPHLIDVRERIMINEKMIPHADFVELMKQIQIKVKNLDDKPTFFEILTAMAIKYFADQAVDVAILETGLGGRLDATTAIKPLVCGLTQISLDHMHILGNTLPLIAAEKAGIMKKGVPVLSVDQDPQVLEVFQKHATETEAPFQVVGRDIEFSYRFEATRELGPHTRICLATQRGNYDHLPVPLKGEHQAMNCGLALALLDKLGEHGFEANEEKIIQGLATTRLPGRMEVIWQEPRILIDGAHNTASLNALVRSIGAHVPYDSLVMIFGCSEDKDITGMLEQVNLGADKVIFTKSRTNPRAAEPQELMARFTEMAGKMSQVAPNLDQALNLAARAVGREDLICITGSFYLVGEAKKYLADLAARRAKQAAAS